MWWMLAAQAAATVASSAMAASAKGEQAKVDKKMLKYENTMLAISAAQSQNAITTNLVQQMQNNADEALVIQKNAILAEGAARVSAGAAGVAGGSVNATMNDVRRNAAVNQYFRKRRLDGIFLETDAQRRQVATDLSLRKNRSVIPKPNYAADILNLGAEGLSLYNQYDKEGYFG